MSEYILDTALHKTLSVDSHTAPLIIAPPEDHVMVTRVSVTMAHIIIRLCFILGPDIKTPPDAGDLKHFINSLNLISLFAH